MIFNGGGLGPLVSQNVRCLCRPFGCIRLTCRSKSACEKGLLYIVANSFFNARVFFRWVSLRYRMGCSFVFLGAVKGAEYYCFELGQLYNHPN